MNHLKFILISIFTPLCMFAPQVVAQQAPLANAAFRLSCEDLIRWSDPGYAEIKIEVKNVNRPSESGKRLLLLVSSLPGNSNGVVVAAPTVPYRLTDFSNQWIAVVCLEDKVSLRVSQVTWFNNEGTLVADAPSSTGVNVVLSVPLDPGTYRLEALVSNQNGTAEIANLTDGFVEGKTTTVVLTQPSRFRELWRALSSSEGLLGSAVIALLAIVAGLLRDQIKVGLNKLLDVIGKFVGGRLAEKRFLKRYLENLVYHHKYLDVIGFNTAGISKPLLEDVFVSLRITHRTSYDSKNSPTDHLAAISFNAAFKSYRHMVMLGGPGTGKTTTLSYALLTFAQDLAKQRFSVDETLLPIYVPLRRLSNTTRSIIEDVTDKNTQILSAEILKEYPSNYFERRLKQGTCLLLLDGLDEVVDEQTHRQIAERINSLLAAYPENHFVVTCRTAGWKDLLSGEFTVLSAQDFDRDDIQRFVLGWYKAVITQSEQSRTRLEHPDPKRFEEEWRKRQASIKSVVETNSRNLIRAINNSKRILAVAVNPMLLSLISLVHLNRQILPRRRTLLYGQCLDLLIESWEQKKGIMLRGTAVTTSQKEAVLREIAFDFQTKGRGEDSRDHLEQFIASILPKLGISISAKDLLEDIETRSGLLTERSLDVFGFTHLTLQEYLVAKHIQLNRNHYDLLTANFDNQGWREVILLYTGLVGDATELIKGIASSASPYRQRLAGYCVGDAEHYNSEVAQSLIDGLLAEVANDPEEADELVNVIAAIAEDFHSEPTSVKEKLSAKLIAEINDESEAITNKEHAIAAIGRARVTHGLPSLLQLLDSDDDRLRVAALEAIVQFGELALPAIHQYLKEERGPIGLMEVIRVLVAINTGTSARTLIKLYDLVASQRHSLVFSVISIQLARLVANPLVEADLLELETADLPAAFSNRKIDNNGWAYGSAKTGFLTLDTEMRRCAEALMSPSDAPLMGDLMVSGISFKILFPAFLTHLKSFPKARLRERDPADLVIFEVLGFDKAEPNKFYYLIDQIKSHFDMPLEFALQRLASANESNLANESKRESWNILSNVCFVFVYLLLLFNGFAGVKFLWEFDSSRRIMPVRAIVFLIIVSVSLLTCAVLIVVTKRKLKTALLTRQFVSILSNPIGGFLKVLPYMGKYSPSIKLTAFHLLVLCLSGYPLFLYVMWADAFPLRIHDPTVLLNIIIPAVFIPLSAYYWKHRVLARNPVLELFSMHPEGRKLLGETN